MEDQEKNNIIELKSRITAARGDDHTEETPKAEGESEDYRATKGSHAASEFIASVIAGGIIGYGVDWMLNTLPWGLIFFLIMGFVSAVYRANAAMKDDV